MRLLVCGGRNFNDVTTAFTVLDMIHKARDVTVVIEGGARGADRIGRQWADQNEILVITYPADWEHLGKSAGRIRNKQMLEHGKPDLVVAFPGGTGTANMVRIAEAALVPVWKHWKETA